jgi:hypothetical protein
MAFKTVPHFVPQHTQSSIAPSIDSTAGGIELSATHKPTTFHERTHTTTSRINIIYHNPFHSFDWVRGLSRKLQIMFAAWGHGLSASATNQADQHCNR